MVRELHAFHERCDYELALAAIFERLVTPAMVYRAGVLDDMPRTAESRADIAIEVVEALRIIAIVLEPFTPETSARMYETFGHAVAFDDLRMEDVQTSAPLSVAELRRAARGFGTVSPLFPPITV